MEKENFLHRIDREKEKRRAKVKGEGDEEGDEEGEGKQFGKSKGNPKRQGKGKGKSFNILLFMIRRIKLLFEMSTIKRKSINFPRWTCIIIVFFLLVFLKQFSSKQDYHFHLLKRESDLSSIIYRVENKPAPSQVIAGGGKIKNLFKQKEKDESKGNDNDNKNGNENEGENENQNNKDNQREDETEKEKISEHDKGQGEGEGELGEEQQRERDIIVGIISGSNHVDRILSILMTWIPSFTSDRDIIIIFTDENILEQLDEAINDNEYLVKHGGGENIKYFIKQNVEFVTLFNTGNSWEESQRKPKLALYYIIQNYFLSETSEKGKTKSGKWAFLVDDDTFVIPENVRNILLGPTSPYDYNSEFYIGRSMTCEVEIEKETQNQNENFGKKNMYQFNHGGSGYALSSGLLKLVYPDLKRQIESQSKSKPFFQSKSPGSQASAFPYSYYSDCEIGFWLKDTFDIMPFHENCFHAQGPEYYKEYFKLQQRKREEEEESKIEIKDVKNYKKKYYVNTNTKLGTTKSLSSIEEDYFANLRSPCTFHYAFRYNHDLIEDQNNYDTVNENDNDKSNPQKQIFQWQRAYNRNES